MAVGCDYRHSLLRFFERVATATVAIGLILGGSAAAQTTWQELTDYAKLQARLGSALPTGAGGDISIVEGTSGGASFINLSGPEFTGLSVISATTSGNGVINGSGVSTTSTSTHATGIAGQYFGNLGSAAPGANRITHYEAINWLQQEIHLNDSSAPEHNAGLAPGNTAKFRVQNHSWVLDTYGSNSQDLAALQKFDYLIDRDEMTAVVGANNSGASAVVAHPHLLVHSYNAIVVGRSDSLHSRGVTNSFYGGGRYRPDIVALNPPLPSTSRATGMVSSAAALLHEAVRLSGGPETDAAKAETMKAILLAGATKTEFANFYDPILKVTNAWDRTPTRPLDDIFGAGELNVYNSYLIQLGGKQTGANAPTVAAQTPVGSFGWDYQNFKGNASAGDVFYNFAIPEGSVADELSIVLAWNVKIDPGSFTLAGPLQNLDLRFYESTGGVLGEQLDLSVSTVDNVEHIYRKNLPAGEYTLKVSGAADWDYGLAWRTATRFDQPSADFNEDGAVDGNDFLAWQRNIGTLINATRADGDADGDGDVDEFDLQEIRNGIAAQAIPPLQAAGANAATAAIPEPGAMVLMAIATFFLTTKCASRLVIANNRFR